MTVLGLYLINRVRTGGDRDYLDILELLAARGNKVIVIFNNFLDYSPRYFTPVRLSVKYRRHHLPPASYLFKKHIKAHMSLIRSSIPDNDVDDSFFIHIHGDIYLKSALFLKKKLGFPLFYASRNDDIDRDRIFRKNKLFTKKEYLFSLLYENINKYREQQIAKYADIIAFLNNYEKDHFVKRTGCTENKIVIIPNNIGPPRFREEFKNKNSSTGVSKIIYVGALSNRKGFWDFLKAAAMLRDRGYINLRYFALGRTENIRPALNIIKNLNLEELVSIEGYKDPFPYFRDCDLFVYPTPYEAFGNVLTESLHSGCPVIASAVGGIPELLGNPELLFTYGNIEEMCSKIEKCINDREYYFKLRLLCIKRAEYFHFDWAGRFEDAMEAYCVKEKYLSSRQES